DRPPQEDRCPVPRPASTWTPCRPTPARRPGCSRPWPTSAGSRCCACWPAANGRWASWRGCCSSASRRCPSTWRCCARRAWWRPGARPSRCTTRWRRAPAPGRWRRCTRSTAAPAPTRPRREGGRAPGPVGADRGNSAPVHRTPQGGRSTTAADRAKPRREMMQERGDALRRAVRLGLLAMVVGAGPVLAADATFEVEGGSLEQVLPEFARQAGLQIIAPAGEAGRPSPQVPALSGTMDTREALARLIANTGLEVAADDGQTITLYRPQVLASLAAAPAPRP